MSRVEHFPKRTKAMVVGLSAKKESGLKKWDQAFQSQKR
jgi:hypothetical protein